MKAKDIWIVITSAAICLLLGLLSGLFTISEINNWYGQINKPTWNPPNWLFGPVWSVLYILMGIAFGYILIAENPTRKTAVILFYAQFLLNIIWSFIFFKMHNIEAALIDIVALLVTIILCIIAFYRINKAAAYLLVPYLIWVSFATALNATIWMLN